MVSSLNIPKAIQVITKLSRDALEGTSTLCCAKHEEDKTMFPQTPETPLQEQRDGNDKILRFPLSLTPLASFMSSPPPLSARGGTLR